MVHIMAKNLLSNISSHTRRIMALVESGNESDEDIDSDASYVPYEMELLSSDEDTASEIDINDCFSDVDEVPSILPLTPQNNRIDLISPRTLLEPKIESPSSALRDSNENGSGESINKISFGWRNCFEWNSRPLHCTTETTQENKVQLPKLEGPSCTLGDCPTPEHVWRLFFTREMVEEIVKHTNSKLASMREQIELKSDPRYKKTDCDEIYALIGLFLLCSIFKSSRESLRSLFSTSIFRRPIFRAIMSESRCFILTRALRFDDSTTRKVREETDPAAAVSNLFRMFIDNCQNNYSMGAHGCVDEILVPFRGRVRFLIYMPKKPAKYGMKLVCLTDTLNTYLYNAYIYTGKGSHGATLTPAEQKLKIPTQSLVRLTKCLYKTNRNITCGNWFCSIEAGQELKRNGLTIVATMKCDKPQIPSEFLPNKKRVVGSSLYGFTKEFTLLSYVPKKSKAMLLLSSMHHSELNDTRNGKPEIVSFYNATKSGVDTLDMKCSKNSTNRTRRWPLAIFYYMLAMSSSNSYILYKMYSKAKNLSRFEFLKILGTTLAKPFMKKRLSIPNLSNDLRKLILEAVGEDQDTEASSHSSVIKSDRLEKRKACRFCPYQKKRATSYKCIQCEIPTCLECSKKICNRCIKNQ